MNVLLDSSVLLRKLFGEPNPLAEWPAITHAYACRLLPIEVGRVIDRCRLVGQVDDDDVVTLHQEATRILRSVDVLAMTEPILQRAALAMPTVVGTLDAIHLATALELGRYIDDPVVLATHDVQLARGGLAVIGAA